MILGFARAATFAVSFVLGVGISTAQANVDIDGKGSSVSTVDGAAANVRGDSFHPDYGQCVVYSVTMGDDTAFRQLETGLLRCNNLVGIDGGTCPGGYTFAEGHGGGNNYYCNSGNKFYNSVAYYGSTTRTSATSTNVSGSIDGAAIGQTNFALHDDIYAEAWAEATGSSSNCPSGGNDGHLGYFARYEYGSGWVTVTSGRGIHYNSGVPANCWKVSSLSANGSFDVTEN